MRNNYITLDKEISLFYKNYAYIDHDSYLADDIFISKKIKVKFKGDFKWDDSNYRVVLCKVKKKDSKRFEKALEELEDKMLLTGHVDYEEACKKFSSMISNDS